VSGDGNRIAAGDCRPALLEGCPDL